MLELVIVVCLLVICGSDGLVNDSRDNGNDEDADGDDDTTLVKQSQSAAAAAAANTEQHLQSQIADLHRYTYFKS